LIIAGALMLQRSPGRVFSDPRATVIATIAMLGSALYSMADAHAMLYAPPDTFLFWVYTLIALQLAFATVLVERGNRSIWRSLVSGWIESPFRVALAAVASYASYQLILIAFQMRADAAEVSAVRQASIPISIVLAAVLLREPSVLQRVGWGLLIACGIAILATI
jgi:drug/metabolite transporter (DMT)-like permease